MLVGPPGAGKTTVGRLLAKALGVGFLDTDEEVERTAGMSVAELFRTRGEPAFRELEHEAVLHVLAHHDGVVALGGGAVMHPGTRAALRGHPVVFLDVDASQAAARVGHGETRPLLAGDPAARLATLMAERRPVYEEVAALRCVTTDRRPRRIAEDILHRLPAAGSTRTEPVPPAAGPAGASAGAEPVPPPAGPAPGQDTDGGGR